MLINKLINVPDAAGTIDLFNGQDLEPYGMVGHIKNIYFYGTTADAATITLNSSNGLSVVAKALAAGASAPKTLTANEADGLVIDQGTHNLNSPTSVKLTTGATTGATVLVSMDIKGA